MKCETVQWGLQLVVEEHSLVTCEVLTVVTVVSLSLTHTLVRCEILTVGTVNFIGLWDRILGLQEVEAHRLLYSRHMKVARLSALHTGRLYPRGDIIGTYFC
jgi:hypothetical protein